MADLREVIREFEDYEPYAFDLPAVTIKSRLFLDALEKLREFAAIAPLLDEISESIHETAKMFRKE